MQGEPTPAPSPAACPIPCNLCGGTDIEEMSLADRGGQYLRTTMCRHCGLVWSNPRPSAASIRRYYSGEYRQRYRGSSIPSPQLVVRAGLGALDRYRTIDQLLSGRQKILDVGAGSGELVYVLRRLGFQVEGLEPDPAYSEYARTILGVPVRTAFVQDVEVAPESLDVVLSFHSLEHMDDPSSVLVRLRNWLTPGGVLVVEVPNLDATCHAPGHRFHFAHFYTFSPRVLCGLGEKAGFEATSCRLSEDGGNIIAVFARSDSPQDWRSTVQGAADRSRHVIQTHTPGRYYATVTPYRRLIRKAWRQLQERRRVRRYVDVQFMLDEVIGSQIGRPRRSLSG